MDRASRALVVLLVLGAVAVATYRRNTLWHDEIGLLRDARSKAPHNVRILDNLCEHLYRDQARYDEALTVCIEAVSRDPGAYDPHLNLWRIYTAKGMRDEAEREFRIGAKLLNKTIDAQNELDAYRIWRQSLHDTSNKRAFE